jgi:hypothetical protein
MKPTLILTVLILCASAATANAQTAQASQTTEQKVATREAIQSSGVSFWDNKEFAGFKLLYIQSDHITGVPNAVLLIKPVEVSSRTADERLVRPRMAIIRFSKEGLFSAVIEYDCVSKHLKIFQNDGSSVTQAPKDIPAGSYWEMEWKFACNPKSPSPTLTEDNWKMLTRLPNVNYR